MAGRPLEIDVLSVHPQAFDWLAQSRPLRNAAAAGSLAFRAIDLRAYGRTRYRQVDDAPYGGGAGMVIRVDVVCAALEGVYAQPLEELRARRRIAVLTPVGRQLTDALAGELTGVGGLTLLAGRYEGFDQRVHDHVANDEISVGPYVLSGGEVAALAVVDAVVRKLPGALGHEQSAREESFSDALEGGLEYPHYTRPEEFRGWRVPPVLLSGHHGQVREWRLLESRRRLPRGSERGQGGAAFG